MSRLFFATALTHRQNVVALIILTGASQALGVVRDLLLARAFSISANLEGYLFAESIPLAVTVMFVTVMPLTILPAFVRLATASPTECDAAYRRFMKLAVVTLLPVLAAIVYFAGPIIQLLGSQLSDESRNVAVIVLRALAVNVVCVPVLALNSGYLNARGNFIAPAAAMLLTNMGAIVALLIFDNVVTVAIGSSLGTLIAVLVTTAYIGLGLTKANGSSAFNIELSPALLYVGLYLLMLALAVILERKISAAMGFGVVTLIAYVTKMVAVPQHLFVMSFVRVRIALYSQWAAQGNMHAIRSDFLRSVVSMVIVVTVCVAGAAIAGVSIARLLFGALSAKHADQFHVSILLLTPALLPMFLNALFIGVASAQAKLALLPWPSVAQTAVLGVATAFLPNGLGAPAAAAVIAAGHLASTLVWLCLLRRLFDVNPRLRTGELKI